MDWLLLTGCLIAAWAMLSVLGGERQRLINELPATAPNPPGEARTSPKSAPPKKH